MKRILFASDLDNTLIFSHKHRRPGDICVEWFEGREQSFMTPRAYELLQEAASIANFMPITTRSIEQYKRIQLPVEPERAVTTNGGILLQNGTPDAAWLAESQRLAEPYQAELARLYEDLPGQDWCLRRKMVDGLYLFAVCEGGAGMCAAACQGRTPLTVAPSGRKLYFFPPGLDKGTALGRLTLPEICAGDSALDVPMLRLAGTALVPDWELARLVGGGNVQVCPETMHFSEFILESVLKLSRGENEWTCKSGET